MGVLWDLRPRVAGWVGVGAIVVALVLLLAVWWSGRDTSGDQPTVIVLGLCAVFLLIPAIWGSRHSREVPPLPSDPPLPIAVPSQVGVLCPEYLSEPVNRLVRKFNDGNYSPYPPCR